jgi:hypothetical protein
MIRQRKQTLYITQLTALSDCVAMHPSLVPQTLLRACLVPPLPTVTARVKHALQTHIAGFLAVRGKHSAGCLWR